MLTELMHKSRGKEMREKMREMEKNGEWVKSVSPVLSGPSLHQGRLEWFPWF